jgi:D-glycero-alpha-D-manno-heptose-7-phosphate kinase
VSYSKTENVDCVNEIQHDIVRECLKLFQLKGLEVVTVSDIPGEGSGLGSSSAFTVGLLQALYAHTGHTQFASDVAENAFEIEAHACGHMVGKQDHYAATCGGTHLFEFHKGHVRVLPLDFSGKWETVDVLNSSLMLFWTGMRAKNGSADILQDQNIRLAKGHIAENMGVMLTDLALALGRDLQKGKTDRVGRFVRVGWKLKKDLSEKISNTWIDDLVESALHAGADGAKICGAGGGGFLLVVANPICHYAVEKALGLTSVPFRIDMPGSSVIYAGG